MSLLFWENVNKEIKTQNTTQEWVSRESNISYMTLKGWISKGVLPRADKAAIIAKVLNVSVEYLVTGKDRTIKEFRDIEREIISDLHYLTDDELTTIFPMIHALSEKNKISDKKKQTAG